MTYADTDDIVVEINYYNLEKSVWAEGSGLLRSYQAEMAPSCADPERVVMVAGAAAACGPAAGSCLQQPEVGVGLVGCLEAGSLLKLHGAPSQLPGLVA